MNDMPLRQPVAPEGQPRKNGCLFGCLGAVIGVPVLLVIIGYYVLMYTAVPLRLVANLLDQDDQITIKGIGGSISKGFTIETFRYSDDAGNESVLEGLTLQWGDIGRMRKNQELVIEKIGLRSAHFYVDGSGETQVNESESGDAESSNTGESEDKLKLFEIKVVDIREVVIESTTGDFKLQFDEILMKGFRIKDNDFDLASLTVGSNFLDLNLEDADTVTIAGEQVPFKRRITGVLKPGMHKSLAKEVDFTVELGAIDGEMITRVRSFNGAMEAVNLGPLGYETITFKDFTPADYLNSENSGPVGKLTLEIQTGSEADLESGLSTKLLKSGSFNLGTALFTMAPQVLSKDSSNSREPSESIVATSQHDGLEITATLKQEQEPPFYRVNLSSKPPLGQRDLVALLWFGKAAPDLTADQAAEVELVRKRHFPHEE